MLFFKQKTSYDLRISDWSSDVCSSDLLPDRPVELIAKREFGVAESVLAQRDLADDAFVALLDDLDPVVAIQIGQPHFGFEPVRSEEHTSELQSLMRISYAVFCLKKKKKKKIRDSYQQGQITVNQQTMQMNKPQKKKTLI